MVLSKEVDFREMFPGKRVSRISDRNAVCNFSCS
jgi:hypothetical protein